MTARETLARAADALHRDFLLACADEAAERGDTVSEAGYRWMAENGKWPDYCAYGATDGRKLFVWNSAPGEVPDMLKRRRAHELPFWAANWMPSRYSNSDRTYEGCGEALEAAAEAIGRWLGKTGGEPCARCDGTGRAWKVDHDNGGGAYLRCKACGGSGRREAP